MAWLELGSLFSAWSPTPLVHLVPCSPGAPGPLLTWWSSLCRYTSMNRSSRLASSSAWRVMVLGGWCKVHYEWCKVQAMVQVMEQVMVHGAK